MFSVLSILFHSFTIPMNFFWGGEIDLNIISGHIVFHTQL